MSTQSTEKAATHHASLGAILTITTGTMLAPLDEFYGLQDFLAGRPLMTHERTVAADQHAAALMRQFPRLSEVSVPQFAAHSTGSKEASVRTWVASVADHLGWAEAEVQWVPGCQVDPTDALERALGCMTERVTPPVQHRDEDTTHG